MRGRRVFLIGFASVLVMAGVSEGFSQAQNVQNRIPQQIVIGGQRANGAYTTAPGGGLQSFTCPNPQQYVTPDNSSQGWACLDQATGVWLLNALPPAQAQAPAPVYTQQPTVVYQQPPATIVYQQPAVVYASPAYYPVVVAPAYPSSVVLGTAAINAAGRIVSAAVIGSRYPRVYRSYPVRGRYR